MSAASLAAALAAGPHAVAVVRIAPPHPQQQLGFATHDSATRNSCGGGSDAAPSLGGRRLSMGVSILARSASRRVSAAGGAGASDLYLSPLVRAPTLAMAPPAAGGSTVSSGTSHSSSTPLSAFAPHASGASNGASSGAPATPGSVSSGARAGASGGGLGENALHKGPPTRMLRAASSMRTLGMQCVAPGWEPAAPGGAVAGGGARRATFEGGAGGAGGAPAPPSGARLTGGAERGACSAAAAADMLSPLGTLGSARRRSSCGLERRSSVGTGGGESWRRAPALHQGLSRCTSVGMGVPGSCGGGRGGCGAGAGVGSGGEAASGGGGDQLASLVPVFVSQALRDMLGVQTLEVRSTSAGE